MLETIVKQQVIFYAMGILMVLGIVAKLVSHFTVRRIVRAAAEIHKSNHRLMKLVKAKFEHASMISDKVQNVGAFVEKYIYEYKVLGIRLVAWRSFTRKVVWLISILGVFAIFESYRLDGMNDLTLQYAQWTGIYLLFLLLLGFVAEETSRLEAVKNYMVEYLENVCVHRYAKMNQSIHESQEEEEEIVEDIQEDNTEEAQATEEEIEEQTKSDQEMRIRAILEEFLA